MSGTPVARDSRSWAAHHPVLKQHLTPDQTYDPRAGVVLTRAEHEAHHARTRPVPLERLPSDVIEFAEELGPWAVAALLRAHPVASPDGPGGRSQ